MITTAPSYDHVLIMLTTAPSYDHVLIMLTTAPSYDHVLIMITTVPSYEDVLIMITTAPSYIWAYSHSNLKLHVRLHRWQERKKWRRPNWAFQKVYKICWAGY